MVSEVRFQLAIGKIAAHLRGSCLSVILHWQLQRNNFFFKIHTLNLRKKEHLCFDDILFVNYSSVITKYPFLTLSCDLKVGRARWECLFWAFIVLRKTRLQKTWSCVRGKKSMKGEFKWDFERLKWDFCWIAKLLFEYKGILVFLDNIFWKTFWD